MPKPRNASSYSLTQEAKDLLVRLSEKLGVSQSATLEMAVRKFAQAELPPERPGKKKSEKGADKP